MPPLTKTSTSQTTQPVVPLQGQGANAGFQDNTINVANAGTPQQKAAESDFNISTPEVAPAEALGDGVTQEDVLAERAARERQQQQQRQAEDDAASAQAVASSEVTGGVFDDPEAYIENLLFGEDEPSQVEEEIADIRESTTRRTENIAEELTQAETERARELGLSTLQKNLSDTQSQIAQRRVALRRRIRNFENEAEDRGFAREFVSAERQKIVADATAELADLSIIESAQQGNLTRAQGLIDTAVNNRYRAFEIENAEAQARIEERLPQLQREQKKEAQQLQIALQEQARQIQDKKDQDKLKRQMLITAAENGAPQDVQSQILNAADVDTATLAAGPYIGRNERLKLNSQLATQRLARRKNLVDLALKGDQSALNQLGAFGQSLRAQLEAAEGAEEYEAKLQRDYEYASVAEKAEQAQALIENELGAQLSSGILQSPLASSFANILGGSVLSYAKYRDAKQDFLGGVQSLLSQDTLDELVRRKEQGATFGALSNEELRILEASANQLSGLAIRDPETGNLTGFRGSEAKVQELLNVTLEKFRQAGDKINTQELDTSESREIDSIINE